MGQQKRDAAIQGHGLIQFIFEHIQRVEAIGLVEVAASSGRSSPWASGGQRQRHRVLRQTVHVSGVREGHVYAHGGGTAGARVHVSAEGVSFVQVRQSLRCDLLFLQATLLATAVLIDSQTCIERVNTIA